MDQLISHWVTLIIEIENAAHLRLIKPWILDHRSVCKSMDARGHRKDLESGTTVR